MAMTSERAREEFGPNYNRMPRGVKKWLRECPFRTHPTREGRGPVAIYVTAGQLRRRRPN